MTYQAASRPFLLFRFALREGDFRLAELIARALWRERAPGREAAQGRKLGSVGRWRRSSSRAEAILAELPDYIWDGDRPPIPVEEIADTHFGLHVRDVAPAEMREAPGCPKLGDDETLSGLLLPSLGQIWVNADEATQWPPRRRFTIAHELGHHVLHRTGQQSLFCRKATVDPEDEKPATTTAADSGHRAGGKRLRRRAADARPADRGALPPHRRQLRKALPRCSSRAARRWAGGCTR